MPRERVINTRVRRAEKVRTELSVRADSSASTANLLRQDDLPQHLQPLKENYEVSIVADEIQKQKRVKAQRTIVVIAQATHDAVLDVNDGEREAIESVNDQRIRDSQRKRATQAIDTASDIAYRALHDGLEEGAIRVNEIADSDPRAQRVVETIVEIDDLTLGERLKGKVRRKR